MLGITSPNRQMRLAVGVSSPRMSQMRVVLPDPLGPLQQPVDFTLLDGEADVIDGVYGSK